MPTSDDGSKARELVAELHARYNAYMAALRHVIDLGEPIIPFLTLNRSACAEAQALGLLMNRCIAADSAIPQLVECIIHQWPVSRYALEALVSAKMKVVPYVVRSIVEYAKLNDDEAVANLLHLAGQFPDEGQTLSAQVVFPLLDHPNSEIRERTANFFAKIGLPIGKIAIERLTHLAAKDPNDEVRQTAKGALIKLGSLSG